MCNALCQREISIHSVPVIISLKRDWLSENLKFSEPETVAYFPLILITVWKVQRKFLRDVSEPLQQIEAKKNRFAETFRKSIAFVFRTKLRENWEIRKHKSPRLMGCLIGAKRMQTMKTLKYESVLMFLYFPLVLPLVENRVSEKVSREAFVSWKCWIIRLPNKHRNEWKWGFSVWAL